MSPLKAIRKNKTVNKIVRSFLKNAGNHLNVFQDLQKRWPPSGWVNCEFKNVPFKMYSECDDGLVYFFFYDAKFHEAGDLQLFMHLSACASCIFDIGANTGVFSLLASKSNPLSEIYAFEPYKANAVRMKLNLAANGINNVRVIEEALGSSIGEIELAVPRKGQITDIASANIEFSRRLAPKIEWDKIKVPSNTIDHFKRNVNKPVNLIKCDVETYEIEVLKGAESTIKTDHPTILVECLSKYSNLAFLNDFIKRHSYYVYFISEDGVLHSPGGFAGTNTGLNYLMTPVKPRETSISMHDRQKLISELLLRPSA